MWGDLWESGGSERCVDCWLMERDDDDGVEGKEKEYKYRS